MTDNILSEMLATHAEALGTSATQSECECKLNSEWAVVWRHRMTAMFSLAISYERQQIGAAPAQCGPLRRLHVSLQPACPFPPDSSCTYICIKTFSKIFGKCINVAIFCTRPCL